MLCIPKDQETEFLPNKASQKYDACVIYNDIIQDLGYHIPALNW